LPFEWSISIRLRTDFCLLPLRQAYEALSIEQCHTLVHTGAAHFARTLNGLTGDAASALCSPVYQDPLDHPAQRLMLLPKAMARPHPLPRLCRPPVEAPAMAHSVLLPLVLAVE
jgi:hypothetical protein